MPCSDNDKIVYNIKELPEVFSIEPIDMFIVETLAGTSVVSFDNIVFDLNQTTFEEQFNKHTTDILELSSAFGLITEDDETLTVKEDIIDTIYPIDSIYITLDNRNPSEILGLGVWAKVSSGKFLAGTGTGVDRNGDSLSLNTEDLEVGEYNVTLDETQIPPHQHTISTITRSQFDTTGGPNGYGQDSPSGDGSDVTTNSTGGGASHNNIPPLFAVNIWQRVS